MLADLNIVDLVFGGLIFLCGAVGGVRGMSRQLVSWSVWIAGVYIIYLYAQDLAATPLAVAWVRHELMRLGAVIFLMIVGVMMASWMAQLVVKTILVGLGLSLLDRFVGLFVGVGQGCVLTLLAVSLVDKTYFKTDSWWQSSHVVIYARQILPLYGGTYVDKIVKQASRVSGDLIDTVTDFTDNDN
ncbi:MAG: CvpA family protein [Pseudomonadota bacterium]|nr:CvpA family protein [Pseudomonadota bacterium]